MIIIGSPPSSAPMNSVWPVKWNPSPCTLSLLKGAVTRASSSPSFSSCVARRSASTAARPASAEALPGSICSVSPHATRLHLAAAGVAGRRYGVELHRFGLGERISVIGRGLGRAVYDGREKLRHARIGQRLEDDLPADAVRVALRDAYFKFLF